jgi:hypothetical protein
LVREHRAVRDDGGLQILAHHNGIISIVYAERRLHDGQHHLNLETRSTCAVLCVPGASIHVAWKCRLRVLRIQIADLAGIDPELILPKRSCSRPASKKGAMVTGPNIGMRYSKLKTTLRIAAGRDDLIDGMRCETGSAAKSECR